MPYMSEDTTYEMTTIVKVDKGSSTLKFLSLEGLLQKQLTATKEKNVIK